MGEIWDLLKGLIFGALQYFNTFTNDYGFAIILLTLSFRVLLIPLTWKQTKSMYELQQAQPKMKALQEKYKNDKEKLNEEMAKFMSENKVNPFGGCLPLLAQMPLFFALFEVLRDNLPAYIKTLPAAAQVTAKHFWVILPDLTLTPQQVYTVAAKAGVLPGVLAALPYVIFVLLFGLSVWLPQYLMTQDPTQRRTGTYMALMMLWFGFVTPAGVLVYWVTSSAFQVGQQMITQRMLKQATAEREAEEAAAKAAAKGKKGKADKADKVDKSDTTAGEQKGSTAKGSKNKGADS